nr:immunoglobulin heavy chain junction region [Mus musculus]
CERGPVAMDYW